MTTQAEHIAVIGAGIAGLTCARMLAAQGKHVRVFEKARGPGGRMSTRRADALRFDHGAQYFTARDPSFEAFLEPLIESGAVRAWAGRIAVLEHGVYETKEDNPDRYVGVPGMSALCRYLAEGLEVAYATRVGDLTRSDGRWRLQDEAGRELGAYDTVVVSAPPAQTAELLGVAAPVIAARAASVAMSPCWAVMAGFEEPLRLRFDGAFVNSAPLSWVARNTSKPDRPEHEAWVLHGSPAWSAANLDLDPETVCRTLWEAFAEATGGLSRKPTHLAAHRWLYALPTEALPEASLFDAELGIAACGDWCGGPRVEGAWLSGRAAANLLLEDNAEVVQ